MVRAPSSAPTRRALLGSAAAALAGSAFPSGVLGQAAKYRRYEISDSAGPSTSRASYKKAVAVMLRLPPTDPRNWYRNAFVHLFDCPHGNWWFLPWHRAYLGWFERTCRDLSGDERFALPYWDWTKSPQVPAVVFEDVLDPNDPAFIASFDAFRGQFEGPVGALWSTFSPQQKAVLSRRGLNDPSDFWQAAGGMFFRRPNARGLTGAAPELDFLTKAAVAARSVRGALRASAFAGSQAGRDPAGFASAMAKEHSEGSRKGVLESQPHDNVHGAMGGSRGEAFMVNLLSPVDPVFFLHHANLDRLWDVWTRRQAALNRATLPEDQELAAWSDEPFLFFSDEAGRPSSRTKSGDYAATGAFEYDYAPGFGEEEVRSGTGAGRSPQRFDARVDPPGPGAGGSVAVPAHVLRSAATEAPTSFAEITLNLGHDDQGRRFRVVVTPPGGAPVEAGAITVFGHHGHAGPATFTVPMPPDLQAGGPGTGDVVPLRIEVVPYEAGDNPRAGGAAPAPQVRAISVVTS